MPALMSLPLATSHRSEVPAASAMSDEERAAVYKRLTDRTAADVQASRERMRAQHARKASRGVGAN